MKPNVCMDYNISGNDDIEVCAETVTGSLETGPDINGRHVVFTVSQMLGVFEHLIG